ncbi:hypothetical protein JM93_01777 [Roseibium hamelinense]|uniref:Cytochrome c domain-containing protein n=1 Tax=Roseibium hamelinense TaxID=150831 RepID=A0A562T875_9HYPH|nr:hypothetical protein [Roseibium hamelinense]MTI42339.1 hypothetical protein [Roseibium hamelinense]TWI89573.1 hypothetical protein JM93_01777 [Roseibium hamelinense]
MRKPKSLHSIRCVFAITALLIAHGFGSGRAEASEPLALVQKGLELSKTHCGRCHIVSKADRFAGISSTPSFMIMIEALSDWQQRFDTFMARRPHPAHIRFAGDNERPEDLPSSIAEVVLTLAEIEAIRAYVDQLAADLGKS